MFSPTPRFDTGLLESIEYQCAVLAAEEPLLDKAVLDVLWQLDFQRGIPSRHHLVINHYGDSPQVTNKLQMLVKRSFHPELLAIFGVIIIRNCCNLR